MWARLRSEHSGVRPGPEFADRARHGGNRRECSILGVGTTRRYSPLAPLESQSRTRLGCAPPGDDPSVRMNTIGKGLQFCTVRIHATLADGSTSKGTGFFYEAKLGGGDDLLPVLVTNKHVVAGAITGTIFFIASDSANVPRLGHQLTMDFPDVHNTFESYWTGHPRDDVDITCMLVGPQIKMMQDAGKNPFLIAISAESCPTPELLDSFEVDEPIEFVGYPNALYDTVHLTPIWRRGSTATPIELDWRGLPAFLIDASVFPGSSGSPVFLIRRAGVIEDGIYKNTWVKALFLGILASTHLQPDSGTLVVGSQSPTLVFNQFLDLGVVFKWSAVDEAVESACVKNGVDRRKVGTTSATIGPQE